MKKLFSLLAIAAIGIQANAQDASVKEMQTTATTTVKTDTTNRSKNGWTKGLLLNFNLTQVGNSNWVAAGGDEFSLSFAGSLNAFASRKWGRKTWDNVLDINYGLMNTTSLGVRKINDRIDFTSKFDYTPKKWKKVSYSLLGQLRSQLTSGYQYDYLGTTEKRRNSGFFAPAYIIVSPGIDWKPNDWFSLFGSPITTRWTVVSNGAYSYKAQGGIFNGQAETPLAKIYGVDPAKGNRGEFGTFITATIKKDLLKNVSYYSKADFFFSYNRNPNNINGRNKPDIFWTNQLKFKVSKLFQVSYTLDMLYDDDVLKPSDPTKSVGLQVLSTFGIGLAYKL